MRIFIKTAEGETVNTFNCSAQEIEKALQEAHAFKERWLANSPHLFKDTRLYVVVEH